MTAQLASTSNQDARVKIPPAFVSRRLHSALWCPGAVRLCYKGEYKNLDWARRPCRASQQGGPAIALCLTASARRLVRPYDTHLAAHEACRMPKGPPYFSRARNLAVVIGSITQKRRNAREESNPRHHFKCCGNG